MIVYWFMFATVAFAVLIPRKMRPSQSVFMLTLVCSMFGLLIGLRHDVGGDWINYERHFQWVSEATFRTALVEGKDPAFFGLAWVVASLGGSLYALNLVCAAPLAWGVAQFAKRQPMPWLALLAAVPYLLIVVGMGYTRQSAAIGFAMVGLVALGDGRTRQFVVWVLLAATFHKSAALLVPIAAVAASRDRIWTALWVGAIALFGSWLFLFDSADTLFKNYVQSEYSEASQGAAVRVIMNAVPAVIFLLKRDRLARDETERRLWTWVATLALVCVLLLPISATAVDRIALYFIPIQLLVFGRITRLVGDVRTRTLLVVAVILYYFAVQFVWLNFASNATRWLPYHFMPLGS